MAIRMARDSPTVPPMAATALDGRTPVIAGVGQVLPRVDPRGRDALVALPRSRPAGRVMLVGGAETFRPARPRGLVPFEYEHVVSRRLRAGPVRFGQGSQPGDHRFDLGRPPLGW